MKKMLTVALRNFVNHLRKPSFYLATFGAPLVLAIILLIASAAADEGTTQDSLQAVQERIVAESLQPIGYIDYSGTITGIPTFFPADFIVAYPDEQAGREALRSGAIGTFYVLPADYPATGKVRRYISGTGLGAEVGSGQLFEVLLLTNLLPDRDPQVAMRLERPMQLQEHILSQPGLGSEQASAETALLMPVMLAVLFTIAIFMSSGLLLQAVVEEKENRTIEVIMSSLAPLPFLGGKVLGLGLLGLLQMVIWVGLALGLFGSSDRFFAALGSLQLTPWIWLVALLYFLLGYLLFALLLAGIGAVSTTVREGSQLSVLISLPASAPLFLAGPIAINPNSAVSIGLSLFPLTSPTAMLMRLVAGQVPFWQIAVSLALLLVAALTALLLSSRLFRAATLLTGKRLSPREIWRALSER